MAVITEDAHPSCIESSRSVLIVLYYSRAFHLLSSLVTCPYPPWHSCGSGLTHLTSSSALNLSALLPALAAAPLFRMLLAAVALLAYAYVASWAVAHPRWLISALRDACVIGVIAEQGEGRGTNAGERGTALLVDIVEMESDGRLVGTARESLGLAAERASILIEMIWGDEGWIEVVMRSLTVLCNEGEMKS